MFSMSLLAFALLTTSNALSISTTSDSTTSSPAPTATPASVLGPVSQLNIANKFIAPDGFNRSATLVNGIFPGPLIQANMSDQFVVKLVNQLTDNTMPLETSVHWHGIFQRKSNWADGVSYVTQCPLRFNEAFTAQFTPVGQSGTYWYHSHYSTQYCDGLRGPLVIYDPEDPLASLYDVDDANTVITLSDWYHQPSPVLTLLFGPVVPDATLVNGLGRYAGGPSTPLSVTNVQPGLRYRFRVVSLSCNPSFNFTIDGHRMTVIEADGDEVEPVEVDSLPVLAGQRYSVVVTANQSVGNYWIRASTSLSLTFANGQNSAILRYEGAPDEDPTTAPGPYELSFNEGSLHPLINPSAPGVPEIGKADMSFQLATGINATGYFTFNNVSFANPSVPVLLQILSGAQHPSQLLPNGSVYILPPNKVIEINFPNPTAAAGFPHPIHLHGHKFSVVRVAGSSTTNFVNPVRRDVVSIGSSATDNVTIRFITDNPGPWFLHCHIDWHLNHGFAAVMAEAPKEAAQELGPVIPADWNQLCGVDQNWGQTRMGMRGI
ncbi:laccase [Butyriboletus roseoflavus]|nr:laccase [Butyriboletus roseoflavus]